MGRDLGAGLHGYDAVELGDRIVTGSRQVTRDLIAAFGDLTLDHFEIHESDAGAARHGFAAQVAHGLLVLSLIDGLKNQSAAQFHAMASLGWDWEFRKPVYAQDTIRAEMEVTGKRPTSKPDRAVLTIKVSVFNQHGAIVQRGTNRLMAYRSEKRL